eukprot:scaffold93308_cov30-Prasinocladus_malaysianus.AAC.1
MRQPHSATNSHSGLAYQTLQVVHSLSLLLYLRAAVKEKRRFQPGSESYYNTLSQTIKRIGS